MVYYIQIRSERTDSILEMYQVKNYTVQLFFACQVSAQKHGFKVIFSFRHL